MPIPNEVNDRIDKVLSKNKFHEVSILVMAIFIFLLGMGTFAYGIYKNSVFIVAPSTLITACLYWPINLINKIRRENITLAAIPSLISTLPPDEAARELIKLLAKLT